MTEAGSVESQYEDESVRLLENLLVKAEKYTQFLNKQLIKSNDDVETSGDGDKGAESQLIQSAKRQKPIDQPPNLTGGTLKDYQVIGYKWLVGLYENGLNGILADEMGLGKTVQTIALLAHLRSHGVKGPFLLVVPLSTLPNWESEFKKWVPSMPCLKYHGCKEYRHELRRIGLGITRRVKGFDNASQQKWREKNFDTFKSIKKFNSQDLPVVLATYAIVSKDRSELMGLKYKYIIVDEGHRLKNHKCKLYRELNFLTRGSVLTGGANKLLLTGTPIMNSLTELWSLLHFLMPEIFDNLELFNRIFEFDNHDLVEKERKNSIVSKLHKILAPFMMRRLKKEVEQNLPEKREVVLYCEMVPQQKGMYESIVTGELKRMLREDAVQLKSKTLNNIMMQLRKCSNHPFLHFESTQDTNETLVSHSGKMVVLDYMLKHFRKNGHKVLIFSQFTTMLDIIEDYLTLLRKDHNFKFCRIDGGTDLDSRKNQMEDFNAASSDIDCFLLSTRSGGVGINLVAADTVILFDSDFNPQMDAQAQDRVHRIGQKKNVAVYRLISANSVELKILQKANSKRKLERVVCARQARSTHVHSSSTSSAGPKKNMSVAELRDLLRDDFTGHNDDEKSVGVISDMKDVDVVLDRSQLFTKDFPTKGKGYEIVSFKAASIVGSLH